MSGSLHALTASRSLSYPLLPGTRTSSTLEYGHIPPMPSLVPLSSRYQRKKSSSLSFRPTIHPYSTSSSANPHFTQSTSEDRSCVMKEGNWA